MDNTTEISVKSALMADVNVPKAEVTEELKRAANRYHVIGAWVAILFDPLFAVTDYINIPESWVQVFIIRIMVALVTGGAIYLFKKGKIDVFVLVAIPLYLISLQNAYTYFLIGPEDLLGHNLNFLALFLGAGLFILWPIRYSIIAILTSAAAASVFIMQNPNITPQQFALDGGLLLVTAALFSAILIQARYGLTSGEIRARLALDKSLQITAEQKKEIEKRNKAISQANQEIDIMNKQLQNYNDQLEEKVTQRTQELRKSNNEMEELVYRLSHDFRTPMTNVRGLLEIAQTVQDPEMAKDLFGHMNVSMNRFDTLLNNMTNYSVYWKSELEPREVVMQDLLKETWERLYYMHKNEIQLDWKGGEGAKLNVDKEKLRAAIYSVMMNAIQYQREGMEPVLTINFEQKGDRTHLTFSDNGSGIKADALPKIFDMFYRADARSMGAGMGLYIAKGVTEQLGGKISVDSTEGEGTVVLFDLPG